MASVRLVLVAHTVVPAIASSGAVLAVAVSSVVVQPFPATRPYSLCPSLSPVVVSAGAVHAPLGLGEPVFRELQRALRCAHSGFRALMFLRRIVSREQIRDALEHSVRRKLHETGSKLVQQSRSDGRYNNTSRLCLTLE
eukprot:IDg2557t1